MIDFREIRARVPAQDAVRFYGAKFDHRGWAICPFHGDTYRRGRSWTPIFTWGCLGSI